MTYLIRVESQRGAWNERYGSAEQRDAFLRGLEALASFSADVELEILR